MTVLVPYDGSRPAQQAVTHAIRHWGDQEILLVRVIEAADGSLAAGFDLIKETLKQQRDEGPAELSAELREALQEPDVELRVESVVGKPAEAIVDFAENHDVNHIIMGSHSRKGASRVLLGSVAQSVVEHAPTTVTVVR